MIALGVTDAPVSRVLCLGAHSDDIEIGCGATILTLTEQNRDVAVDWVVFSADGQREHEARQCAELFLRSAAKKNIVVQSFRDGYFPFVGSHIKDYFEELKHQVSPDLVLT